MTALRGRRRGGWHGLTPLHIGGVHTYGLYGSRLLPIIELAAALFISGRVVAFILCILYRCM